MRKIALLLIILLGMNLKWAYAAETYTLSMLPLYSPEEVFSKIKPLAEYLSKELGVKVDPVVTKDFQEYESRLKNGDITIGYSNPLIYVNCSSAHEVLATAADKEGSQFGGIIIVHRDSPIRSLADLKGKKISTVGFSSAGGFLSQRLTLLENGLDTSKDMRVVEAPDNKHENVIMAVYMGDVDAGFIRKAALHSADAYVPAAQIRVLAETASLPNWALSANRSLPESTKGAIQAAVLKLRQNDPALKTLNVIKFENLSDAAYDGLRKTAGLPIPKR